MKESEEKRINKKNKVKIRNTNGSHKKVNYAWPLIIITWTFILSVTLSFVSSTLMNKVSLGIAFGILIFIILFGILFDIIGIAVTAATETPFHSMASRKIAGAKQAIKLIRNAEKVSSFCNDAVGDIAGIISGATTAVIIEEIARFGKIFDSVIVGLVLTGFVAALTVGGKAIGKFFAISKSNDIVYKVGRMIHYFSLWPGKRKK